MGPDASRELNAPFFHYGCKVQSMAMYTLGALVVLALLHTLVYDPRFMLRFLTVVGMGLGLEVMYVFLDKGRLQLRSGSSAVTSALLVMSVPTTTPLIYLFYALVVAIFIVRMPQRDHTLHLNPMLVGRLFLMLAYSEKIINWTYARLPPDATTTATPLELFHSEEALVSLPGLLVGRVGGNWEGLYDLSPGSPGEVFAPMILLLGLFLWRRGVIAWRPGVWFVASFAIASLATGQPIVFSVLAGAIFFSAVFIAGDPKSSPVSKAGQCMFGIVAGILNALIRRYTYYSEGIVFSFLLANMLAPSLDRLTFFIKGRYLHARQQPFASAMRNPA